MNIARKLRRAPTLLAALGLLSLLPVGCGSDRTLSLQKPDEVGPISDPPIDLPPEEPIPPTPAERARPVSGGTLAIVQGGGAAVVSDSDRDQIHIVDLSTMAIRTTVDLNLGDEPGRIVEDDKGRVHVALRGGGAIVSIDLASGTVRARREACAAPRGLAFDSVRHQLHVACAGGELLTFGDMGDAPVRTLALQKDLRDVVVRGDKLLVSVFRSADVLTIDAEGQALESFSPRARVRNERFIKRQPGESLDVSPGVAWRLAAAPGGKAVMIHQRGVDGILGTQEGGYSSFGCAGIVEGAVSSIEPDRVDAAAPGIRSGRALAGMILPVDLAVSPSGKQIAVVSAGNAVGNQVQFFSMDTVADENAPSNGGMAGAPSKSEKRPLPPELMEECMFPSNVPVADEKAEMAMMEGMTDPMPDMGGVGQDAQDGQDEEGLPEPISYNAPNGQIVAVAFDKKGNVLVQSREPAMLQVLTQRMAPVVLSSLSKADAGYSVFHGGTRGQVACASCHPEGTDDGRVWSFEGIGSRRTQPLRGGIMDTAPFHWNGDMRDFRHLMGEVFEGRMQGQHLDDKRLDVLVGWVDSLPTMKMVNKVGPAAEAAARGKALFESPSTLCATCHSGEDYTNGDSYDVGTSQGIKLQVPQLHGLAGRAPFMHNGCADTLAGRFDAKCGGGDKHGRTSHLNPDEISDLVAYMETM